MKTNITNTRESLNLVCSVMMLFLQSSSSLAGEADVCAILEKTSDSESEPIFSTLSRATREANGRVGLTS